MKAANLSGGFPGVVAHGLHSLTLEDIRHYFKPGATERNRIPTIDLDLTSATPVLPNAPSRGKSPFMSVGLRALDKVLMHMDDTNYDLRKYSTMGKVVHSLHMHEMWTMAQPQYDHFVTNPPNNATQLCRCVSDVDNNGIYDMLKFVALKIREPDLMHGLHMEPSGNGGRLIMVQDASIDKGMIGERSNNPSKNTASLPATEQLNWSGVLYPFVPPYRGGSLYNSRFAGPKGLAANSGKKADKGLVGQRSNNPSKNTDSLPMTEQLNWSGVLYPFVPPYRGGSLYNSRFAGSQVLTAKQNSQSVHVPPADNLAREDRLPLLTSEMAWKYWKGLLTEMDEADNRQLALFLYCMLN